jgi:hypothetical protein
MRALAAVTVLVACTVATTSCGAVEDAGPRATAQRFADAVSRSDYTQACSVLASTTRSELEKSAGVPCPSALEAQDLQPVGALTTSAVFGTMAQVRFTDDTVFVAKFARGWRVLASGCAPVPGGPYDCQLKGD